MNVRTNNPLMCTIALNALVNVVDPEIGLNVVDLGLIYNLDFDETGMKILCTMTLTTQFCPMGESITSAVDETLQTSFGGYKVILQLVFNPPWNYDRISEEGRIFLNR